MAPPNIGIIYDHILRDQAKGNINLGGINIAWDFTEIYEEIKKQRELEKRHDFVDKNGKIIMFNLGII